MAKGRTTGAGLTLVEFLFATSVIAFVGLGVAGMFPAALRSVVTGGQVSKATMLAQEMVDMIRTESFSVLNLQPTQNGYNGLDTRTVSQNMTSNNITCPVAPPTPPANYNPQFNPRKWTCDLVATGSQTTGRGLPYGYGTVSVSCLNPNGSLNVGAGTACPTDLQRVTVTVTWNPQGASSVSLITHVARVD